MKEFINKIKNMDKTKRIVILFITISFVFIGSFSIYNGVTGNYKTNQVAQVDTTKNKKEKNTKETKKEEKQETTDQTQETSESTQNDSQSSTQSTDETKTNDESKLNSKSSSTTQSNGKSSSVAHSQSSTNQSQSNSGQTSNNQLNNSSTNSSSNQQPTNEKIAINIQVIGMGNTMMAGTLNVDKNSNALSVLKIIAAKNGKEVEGSDYYVSGIGGLKEKQHGPMSGWMYSVNGVAPNKAAIKYDLKDGDKVVWYYVRIGEYMHSSKVKEISLIGILAAVNIASRIYLQALPNIKPVTSIIIISVMLFGLGFGVKLSIVTTVVSNLFLGMGTWTFFQILAWVVICLITQVLLDFLKKIHKEPKLFPMAIFSFFMGYIFGIVVSLEQLMLGGPSLYIVYYMAGLLFDTFHAVGNFCFYLICAPILMKVLKKESERIRLKQD